MDTYCDYVLGKVNTQNVNIDELYQSFQKSKLLINAKKCFLI